ncbi:MAG TPA: hypothetical protein VE152_05840, partial [Acidimicrobiales bacterium]|nr:hypothetical protein [Acidimicrobiales bacterium]
MGLLLFLLVAAVYGFTTSGEVQIIDVLQTVAVAENLVRHGSFAIPHFQVWSGGGAVIGVGGQHFAPHGIGLSLLYAPIVALLDVLYGIPHPALALFSTSFVDPFLGAVGVVAAYGVARDLDIGEAPAAGMALLFAFSTIQWAYAHVAFDAVPSETFLLLGVWCLHRATVVDRAKGLWLVGSGASLGFSLLIRIQMALALPFLLGYLAVKLWPRGRERGIREPVMRAVSWGLPIAAALVVVAWFNQVRFGSIFDNGHAADPNTALNVPILTGLHGLLASPGKSIFLFAPPLVVGLAGLCWLLRRQRALGAAIAGILVTNLLLNAKLHNWAGDLAWGPRFLVPFMGLAIIPAAFVLTRWRTLPWTWRAGVVVAGVAGFAVQVLANVFNYVAVDLAWKVSVPPGPSYYWSLSRSQLALTLRSALQTIHGKSPYGHVAAGGITGVPPGPLPHVDFWWVLLRDRYDHVSAVAAVGAVMVVVMLGSTMVLVRRLAGVGVVSLDAGVVTGPPGG